MESPISPNDDADDVTALKTYLVPFSRVASGSETMAVMASRAPLALVLVLLGGLAVLAPRRSERMVVSRSYRLDVMMTLQIWMCTGSVLVLDVIEFSRGSIGPVNLVRLSLMLTGLKIEWLFSCPIVASLPVVKKLFVLRRRQLMDKKRGGEDVGCGWKRKAAGSRDVRAKVWRKERGERMMARK